MKRKFALLSLLLAVLMVFTACSTTADTPSEPGSSSADPAAGGLGAIESGAKLVYWTMWNEAEPQGQVIAEAAEAFEAATGVAVDINFNGRDIRKTLEPALAGGEMVDIFDEDIERVLNLWGDYLLPLDNYVAASYDDTSGSPYRSVVNKTLIDLVENLGAAKGFADGGKIHQIPYQPFIFTVMTNKAVLESAGVTTAPKTWDEFLAACEKIKAAGVTPMTVDDAYMAALFGYTLDRIVGAEKCAEMVENMDFSDPGVLKACELWENMIQNGYLSNKAATNVYPAGQVDEIAKGTVAMYLNGTWLPNEIKDQVAADFQWGSFAWPAIESTGDGTEAHNFGAQSFGIHKDTKYPNAAFAFVRFMTVGEWDQKLADQSSGVPMANNATWPAALADAKAVLDNTTTRLAWAANMEDNPDVNAAIKDGLSKMVTGDYTAQQFADSLAALKK